MTVYLVKEADSGRAERWLGPPTLRPLSREGWRQAAALVECFEARPISRIVAGPNLRCRETVSPLAESRGLNVESGAALAEGADPSLAFELVRTAIAGRPIVLCAHAGLINALVQLLVAEGWVNEDGGDVIDGIVWAVGEADVDRGAAFDLTLAGPHG